jgi:hypothetical protein
MLVEEDRDTGEIYRVTKPCTIVRPIGQRQRVLLQILEVLVKFFSGRDWGLEQINYLFSCKRSAARVTTYIPASLEEGSMAQKTVGNPAEAREVLKKPFFEERREWRI